MKRSILIIMPLLVIVFGLTMSANAGLVVQEPVAGQFVVLDTDTNLMWLQDANYAYTSDYDADGLLKWNDAVTWATTLSYAGFNDWLLPSAFNSDGSGPCYGYGCNDSETGHLYYIEGISSSSPGPFINVQPTNYWSGTNASSTHAWDFGLTDGYQHTLTKDSALRVWAVRVVPEPISSVLFVIGSALFGVRFYLRSTKGSLYRG